MDFIGNDISVDFRHYVVVGEWLEEMNEFPLMQAYYAALVGYEIYNDYYTHFVA